MRRKGRRKWDREYAVGRARRLLRRRGHPRVQVAFLLVVTCCVGFLLSFLLLRAGLTQMWLRYPLVILLSYGVLLLLLWARLGLQRKGTRGPDVDLNLTHGLDAVGGGGGGGGGAGGNWIDGAAAEAHSISGFWDAVTSGRPRGPGGR